MAKKIKKEKRQVNKAVIAAAGYGTRFLPATKNQPKEMLPIIDKPIIHHLVDECVKSGITDIIIVTRAGQGIMEDYFDNHIELEHMLRINGKIEELKKVKEIPQLANFIYVRQKKNLPYGNGTPLLCAAPLIDDDESVVYLFGDDLVQSEIPAVKQLIDVYNKHHPAAVLAVQETPWEEVERYATVKYKAGTKINEIEAVLEKLPKDKAPSNMAQFGRFVFSYKVIQAMRDIPTGKGGELWVADALNYLAEKGEKVIAQPIEGRWMTTGDPLRYLKTTVEFALKREDLAKDFKAYLRSLNL